MSLVYFELLNQKMTPDNIYHLYSFPEKLMRPKIIFHYLKKERKELF